VALLPSPDAIEFPGNYLENAEPHLEDWPLMADISS